MKTFNTIRMMAAIAAVVLAAGCATSEKIQAVQPGDQNLTCEAIKTEFAKLDKATADIDGKKSMNGTNVASALFWLPGLAYTFYDAGEATKLIYERRSGLTTIFNSKNCKA